MFHFKNYNNLLQDRGKAFSNLTDVELIDYIFNHISNKEIKELTQKAGDKGIVIYLRELWSKNNIIFTTEDGINYTDKDKDIQLHGFEIESSTYYQTPLRCIPQKDHKMVCK